MLREIKMLKKAHRIEELISENLEEIRRIDALKDSIHSSMAAHGGGESSENNAAYTRAVEKIEKLKEIILNDNAELAETLARITLMINCIDDLDYRLILRKSLISKKTFAQIAAEIGYSERTVSRKYSEAMEELRKIEKLS